MGLTIEAGIDLCVTRAATGALVEPQFEDKITTVLELLFLSPAEVIEMFYHNIFVGEIDLIFICLKLIVFILFNLKKCRYIIIQLCNRI